MGASWWQRQRRACVDAAAARNSRAGSAVLAAWYETSRMNGWAVRGRRRLAIFSLEWCHLPGWAVVLAGAFGRSHAAWQGEAPTGRGVGMPIASAGCRVEAIGCSLRKARIPKSLRVSAVSSVPQPLSFVS